MKKRLLYILLLTTTITIQAKSNDFCVVNTKWASIHKEAGTKSEPVTQVLFGDPLIVHKRINEWAYVSIPYQSNLQGKTWTNYQGWIELKHTVTPAGRTINDYLSKQRVIAINKDPGLFIPIYQHKKNDSATTVTQPKVLTNKRGSYLPINKQPTKGPKFLRIIPEGAILPVIKQEAALLQILLPDGKKGLISKEKTAPFNKKTNDPEFIKKMIQHAKKYIGKGYVWGGTSPLGVDCSGLVYIASRTAGRLVPRDSSPQHNYFHKKRLAAVKRGDLIFYSSNKTNATHVAIYLGNNQILHASKGNQTGITNINAPSLQNKFFAIAKMVRQKPKPIKKKPKIIKKIVKKTLPKKVVKKKPKKIIKKIPKKIIVKKRTIRRASPKGALFYSIHFASFLKRNNTIDLLKKFANTKHPVYVYPITTSRGTFSAVYSGIFRSRRSAWIKKRAMHRYRIWNKAKIRAIRTSLQGRSTQRFYSIQLMALRNIYYAYDTFKRLHKVGHPVWIKTERDRKGGIWYTLFYGRYKLSSNGKKAIAQLQKLIKIKGKPFLRRVP